MKGITSVLSFCVLTFFATTTQAQENVCDGQIGAAFGLCNAYCEAMDCDSDEPNANLKACDRVYENFLKHTGEDMPCEVEPEPYCPCFTSEDLQGNVFQCGENFPGTTNLAAIIYENGEIACSGQNCFSGDGSLSCAITLGGVVSFDPITAEENDGCQALIMASCDTPNAPVQSALQAGSNGTSVIPFIDR